ncbi:hypothetical protein ID866_7535 [Astraeus odoratus]|nr:hypothetical protein ID866_7535 [Astraeus odoratus]
MSNVLGETVADLCQHAAEVHQQYECEGALDTLEEAISLHQQVLELLPTGDPNGPLVLNNLANCMQSRYRSQGLFRDLEEAIFLSQKALNLCPAGHPNRSSSLNNLGSCLRWRYESQGVLADLDKAISLNREALLLCPIGHPNRSSYLNSLANCMKSWYDSHGALADLHEAISLHQQALDLCHVGHPNRPSVLVSFASCMQSRFQSEGELADLEKAIYFNQQALDLYPGGHPYRLSSLNNLGGCMQLRYGLHGALEDLEEAISLHQHTLYLCPVDHPYRPTSLHNLAISIQSRYESQGAFGDMEEAISLYYQALDIRPVGHPDRPLSLNNLAYCMECRYKSQGALADLEEAIFLHQQTLQICLVGHPIRPMYGSQETLGDLEEAISLHQQALDLYPAGHPSISASLNNLGDCMRSKYESYGESGDLEKAISLLQKALDLCPVNHSNRTSVLLNLASCMQSRYRAQGTLISPLLSSNLVPDSGKLIRHATQDILHDIPPWLLLTNTGILLTQAQMIVHFCKSTQYQTLLTFLKTSNDWHTNVKHMQAVISNYFQYCTLSHRWGPNEPSLQDILSNGSIYNMPPTTGLVKLQRFCDTAAHHGYSWAWSDTCCIDKTNSVELQKAIGSMFLWYQQSALTIVYLADICESSPLHMILSGSEWFRRSWTLQELLAPHTILFYTQDWSPYKNSGVQNHKQDVHVLNELVHASGIPAHHLRNFHAGMDNARSKLQWVVGRHATVPEDVAYSLFGIFNLHLPVLYGEGKEKSLLRLLQEILSQSHDISILHWVGEQSSRHSCFPASISSYQPLPHVQPGLSSLSIQHSMSRLQQCISTDDAHIVYNNFANLPGAKFTDYTLKLPCIVHHVQVVKLRQTYMNYHTYDVQAVGLRPVQVITSEPLRESMVPTKLPYVFIHPWNQNLVNSLEEDHVMAGYKAMMELEKPFMALMLLRLPEGEYKRICASHFIIVHRDNPTSIVNSKTAILDIV